METVEKWKLQCTEWLSKGYGEHAAEVHHSSSVGGKDSSGSCLVPLA